MWEQSSGAFDASGTLITIEGLVNDITEKQKNELGIRRENEELRERLKARCFNNIVGDSPPMREVFELIARARGHGGLRGRVRRIRDGQGAGRPCRARMQRPLRQAVHRGELRGHPRKPL